MIIQTQKQVAPTAHTTQDTLNPTEFFDERIISWNTLIPYPLRACDLTPCEFFLWPYLKNSIFQQPVDNLDELQHIIVEKINEINNFNHVLRNITIGIGRRV
jgi:hypothetical protein